MTLLLYFFKLYYINVTKNTIQLPILSFPLTDYLNCILDKILDKILWNEFRMFWSKITYCSVKWWINTWPWFEDELIFIFGEVVFFSSWRLIFYNRVNRWLRGKFSYVIPKSNMVIKPSAQQKLICHGDNFWICCRHFKYVCKKSKGIKTVQRIL